MHISLILHVSTRSTRLNGHSVYSVYSVVEKARHLCRARPGRPCHSVGVDYAAGAAAISAPVAPGKLGDCARICAHGRSQVSENMVKYHCLRNGATRSATEIGRLVHDLLCPDAEKMYFGVLRQRVSQFKNSEEGRYAMCKAMERIAERNKAEGRAEGEARGERKNMLATAKRMLKSGMLALKDIAKFSGLSLAEVKKLQASMA